MGNPITLLFLIILLLVLMTVLGIFLWHKTHDERLVFRKSSESTKKTREQKRHFTEDDKKAVLLIRELADIINTVDRSL